MSEPTSSRARPLTAAEVVLLCDELRAILAAGVPLHLGLREAGAHSANLQRAVEQLAVHLEQGRSLPEALEAEEQLLPAPLRAIVVAGVCSEQTQDLLEDLARTSEQLQQMRQTLIRGLVYPAFVVVLALILAAVVLPMSANAISATFENSPRPALLGFELRFAGFLGEYGWLLGVLTLLAVGACWYMSRDARNELSGWAFVAWLPGARRVLRDSRLSRSVHLLSLLLRYQVPLPRALRSVAVTVEQNQLRDEILLAADQVERGETLCRQPGSRIPVFLWWMLTTGIRESRLESTLHEAADYYRRSAIYRAEWLARVVPLTIIVLVGGGCTLAYGLLVMSPISSLLLHMLEMRP